VTHYVYLLRCADNSLYVGETSDLATRERHHNDGRGGSYSAKRRPVQIVYAEQYSSREEALRRERQIKRWNSKRKELLVRGDVAVYQVSARRLASEPIHMEGLTDLCTGGVDACGRVPSYFNSSKTT
jgi:predicted GIY-YIG superfamily endonuclease